jgi:hypothetical protein
VKRDFDSILNEVIMHLTCLPGVEVNVTVEIEAIAQDGFPDTVIRTVSENANTLKIRGPLFES